MQLRFGVEVVEAEFDTTRICPGVNLRAPLERTFVVVVGFL